MGESLTPREGETLDAVSMTKKGVKHLSNRGKCCNVASGTAATTEGFAYIATDIVDVRVSAAHFAGAIEARDGVILNVKDFAFSGTLRATLGVQNLAEQGNNVEWSFKFYQIKWLSRNFVILMTWN